MNPIGFSILRRAHENMKMTNNLEDFLKERGLKLEQIKSHPDDYSKVIEEYSKQCINISLFEESRDRLQEEFNRLCEFHARNEEALTKEFFSIAKQIIVNSPDRIDMKQ